MSAQGEHDKNVTVVMRSMCKTQKKIVSNMLKCNLIICHVNVVENVKKMYNAKSLKKAYLT